MNLAQRFRRLTLWNKLGVLGTIASVVGVALYFVPTDPDGPNVLRQSGTGNVQVGSVQGDLIVATGLDPAFSGPIMTRWDTDSGLLLAHSLLQRFKWPQMDGVCDDSAHCRPHHKFVGQYFLPYPSRQGIVLVFASTIDTSMQCRACAASISLFEFQQVQAGWALALAEVNALRWGDWGWVHPEDVSVYPIGDGVFGIAFTDEGGMGGERNKVIELYAKLGDSFQQIWDHEIASSYSHWDPKTDTITLESDWSSTITVRPGVTGIFDLEVATKGLREGRRVDTTETYRFNGHMYTTLAVLR